MSRAITSGLNLLALKGAKTVYVDEVEGIFIPYRKNGVSKYGNNKAYLNTFSLPRQDDFGNDFMVMRSRTQDETREGTSSEILGNAKYLDTQGRGGGGNYQGRSSNQGGYNNNRGNNQRSSPPKRRNDEEEAPF